MIQIDAKKKHFHCCSKYKSTTNHALSVVFTQQKKQEKASGIYCEQNIGMIKYIN